MIIKQVYFLTHLSCLVCGFILRPIILHYVTVIPMLWKSMNNYVYFVLNDDINRGFFKQYQYLLIICLLIFFYYVIQCSLPYNVFTPMKRYNPFFLSSLYNQIQSMIIHVPIIHCLIQRLNLWYHWSNQQTGAIHHMHLDNSLLPQQSSCEHLLQIGERCYTQDELFHKFQELDTQIKKLRNLRSEERKGRTTLERQQRQSLLSFMLNNLGGFILPPIGMMSTSFKNRRGTSRQSLLTSNRSRIHFHMNISAVFNSITMGLEDYSHIWILYLFHENTNLKYYSSKVSSINPTSIKQSTSKVMNEPFLDSLPSDTFRGQKSKVLPPRKLDQLPVGIFGCRSPHRPNPIGLSVAKLIEINYTDKELILEGVDIMDGTPIIDIKPYIPFCDSYPNALSPQWVNESYHVPLFQVTIPHPIQQQLYNISTKEWYRPYETIDALLQALIEVLSVDIRSKYQQELSLTIPEFSTSTQLENNPFPLFVLIFHNLQVSYRIDIQQRTTPETRVSVNKTFPIRTADKHPLNIQITVQSITLSEPSILL